MEKIHGKIKTIDGFGWYDEYKYSFECVKLDGYSKDNLIWVIKLTGGIPTLVSVKNFMPLKRC